MMVVCGDSVVCGNTQVCDYVEVYGNTELIKVPAPGTSQTCSECLHREKGNRISQAEFTCLKCGHNENADVNAAKFILIKGLKQREL